MSVSSSFALASSTRARSSRSCCGMQHSTLGESGVHHRPLHASPIIGVALAYDNDVERHPERAESSTETHHLGVAILGVALHDQKVEVAVRAGVTAGTRAEEHDLDRIGSDGRQRLACGLNDLLRNHDDTVAKLPGGFATGPARASTLWIYASGIGCAPRDVRYGDECCGLPRPPSAGLAGVGSLACLGDGGSMTRIVKLTLV